MPQTDVTADKTSSLAARVAWLWPGIAARRAAASGLARLRLIRRAALQLVFPGTCFVCQAELDPGSNSTVDFPFCGECLDEFELLRDPLCRRCSGPLPKLTTTPTDGCFRCRGRKLWFDETVALGLYAGELRHLLLQMKSHSGDAISIALGELLWHHCAARIADMKPDVVVPIPLHWRRRLVHRTNSASVLAEVLARRLRVPFADGLLRRRRHTARQFDLTPPQRWQNVRQAFSIRGGYHLRDARVLLVDDILTTGATCSEAARTLRRAGAERVTVAVAARAIGE